MRYTRLIKEAAELAEKAHRGQMRKYIGLPYIIHPYSVATAVAGYGGNENAVAAAWLHDVLEDTETTAEEILGWTNPEVLSLVQQLTNPSKMFPSLPRAKRREMDVEHIREASWEAKLVKLADRTDNLLGMLSGDPSAEFRALYVRESEALYSALEYTHAEAENAYLSALASLKKSSGG